MPRILGVYDHPGKTAAAIEVAVCTKESVHIVTDGIPAFSTWIPSCTLHALHEPQSPTPAMT